MKHLVSALVGVALAFQAPIVLADSGKPAIDNERVIAREIVWAKGVREPAGARQYDTVTLYLTGGQVRVIGRDGAGQIVTRKAGDAVFRTKGDPARQEGVSDTDAPRSVVVELKDNPVAALPNNSPYPDAFPRPRIEKRLENDRVRIWDYRWNPNEPTPMHFHGTDVVTIFFEDSVLASTTPDGKVVENHHPAGEIAFNVKNRTHTENLIRGTEHAMMVELK